MEGTIHILNIFGQEYWIDGALVDKVTTSAYSYDRYGRKVYVHYKSGEVEEIQGVVVTEVLGTYKMEPMPIPTTEEEKAGNREQLSPEMKAMLSQKVEELDLSVRTRNLLKSNGIDTILDICRMKKTDCLKFRNGGKKALTELDDFLTAHNLTWLMDAQLESKAVADYANDRLMDKVYYEIDRLDIQEREENKKKFPEWGEHKKRGNATRFMNAITAHNIETVGQLLKVGRIRFGKFRQIGRLCVDRISEALDNLYGIKSW